MNQYYKFSTTGYVDFGVQKAPLLREQSVMQGRVIDPQKLPKLIFEHNFPIGESIPHFLTGGTVLASNKLLTVLESAGVDNYQAIPATLINPNTNEIRADYFLFNILGLIEATILADSNYDELMEGSVEGGELPLVAFNKIVIDRKKINGADMFRLAEDPINIVVSSEVVKALKANKPKEGWGINIENLEVK